MSFVRNFGDSLSHLRNDTGMAKRSFFRLRHSFFNASVVSVATFGVC